MIFPLQETQLISITTNRPTRRQPRPLIPLHVAGPNGRLVGIDALVDTGSDEVLLPIALLPRLGFAPGTGVTRGTTGVGGRGQTVYHPVRLELRAGPNDHVAWLTTVGFAPVPFHLALFGIAGGLEFFHVSLNVIDRQLALFPHPTMPLAATCVSPHTPSRFRSPMRLLDLTLPDPADNLALDEALLLAAENGGGPDVLRFWELPAPAVVVGAGGSVVIDVNAEACAADRVPILRRASGGGTVVLGPGCLCFSLVLGYARAPGLDDIRASNRHVLDRVRTALAPLALAALEGFSDLAVSGVKISGNAQQRKRTHFLHHGTLLCGFDLGLIPKYLNAPERQPDYRRHRSHREFVTNLPATAAELKRLLAAEWQADGDYAPIPLAAVRELVTTKYARDDWTRRR